MTRIFTIIFVFTILIIIPAKSQFKSIVDSSAVDSSIILNISDNTITQGSILLIEVPSTTLPSNNIVNGNINNTPIKFFKDGSSHYSFIGIDLESKKELNFITITNNTNPNMTNKKKSITPLTITKGSYGVQKIKVPKKMVNPQGKNLDRAIKEAAMLKEIYSKSINTRTWNEPFIMPLKGRLSSKFGLKRFYNGIKKSPHNGLDIAAPRGTSVKASNNGLVVFAGDLYYSGNTVIIDHGLNLFTAYYHLSKMNVSVNDFISQGEILGFVGTTGRSTGPHLHWTVKLKGARVSPNDLIKSSTIISKKNKSYEPLDSPSLLRYDF